MDDLLREFVTETNESLDVVDVELVRFEQDPNNAKILDNIFRLVHTIKGTCGFLGLPRLEALAHAAETLMGKFRDGAPASTEAVTLILATIDRIKTILESLEREQREPEGGDTDLIAEARADGRMGRVRRPRARSRSSIPSGRSSPRRWNGRCVPTKTRWTILNARFVKRQSDPPACKACKPAPAPAEAPAKDDDGRKRTPINPFA